MLTSVTLMEKTTNKLKNFPSSLKNQKAFSLIELMIVLAIVAGMVTLAVPRFTGPGTKIKAEIRRFAVLTRKLFQEAQIKKATFRLAIDMTDVDEDGGDKLHGFWIEAAEGAQMMEDPEAEPELDEDGKKISTFTVDNRVMKKNKELPEGFKFTRVSYGGREDVTEGIAYLYFFPQGYTEEALIQISHVDSKLFWSLLINPLTGQVDIITKEVSLKDLKQGK